MGTVVAGDPSPSLCNAAMGLESESKSMPESVSDNENKIN